jgi:DNA polymerase
MTYIDILQSIDWPTEILVIDFETYFDTDYTLSKMSTVEYVTDPRFEFTGLGIEILNHPKANGPIFIPGPDVPWAIKRLQKLFGKALHNCTVVAKNCKFDMLILAEKFGIYPAYPLDIEDLSRTYDSRMSHRLKDLVSYFNLAKPKGDTQQFKGLHYGEMSKEQQANLAEYGRTDIELETALLKILLPYITNPAFELALARHTLNLYLKPTLTMDYGLAEQTIQDMDAELNKSLKLVGSTKKEISGTLSFTKILKQALYDLPIPEKMPVKTGKPGKNMVALLGQSGVIPALAKTDEGFKQLLNHKDEKIRNLIKAKVAIKSWPNWIKRVQSMVNQCKASGNKLRVPLKYYGGHTGRWSGTEKINLQNLGGRGRGVAIHPLIAQVRNLLIAPDGYKLLIDDSAQIEARLLAWLAGQDDLVRGFANGEDIYSVFATTLFGEKVWKPGPDEQTREAKTAKIRRGFGKDAILGCGYGMGTNKFYGRCRENDSLRPLFDSGEYDWDFVDGLIKTYRKMYKKIPKLWQNVEKAFRFVCRYSDQMKEYPTIQEHYLINNPDVPFQPLLRFWKSGNTVNIQLPSGRVLYYHHARVNRRGDIRYHYGKLWGGSLVENIIQAIARDLLGYWILECEAQGIPVCLHCHDEVVSYSFGGNESADLERMNRIMSTGPDWAEGLPLAAEGSLAECYVK